MHEIIVKVNHLFNCRAMAPKPFLVWCTPLRDRVLSQQYSWTVQLYRTWRNQANLNAKGCSSTVPELEIFRGKVGKPYWTTVDGWQNGKFCNQLSANEQVSRSKGLKHGKGSTKGTTNNLNICCSLLLFRWIKLDSNCILSSKSCYLWKQTPQTVVRALFAGYWGHRRWRRWRRSRRCWYRSNIAICSPFNLFQSVTKLSRWTRLRRRVYHSSSISTSFSWDVCRQWNFCQHISSPKIESPFK